MNEVVAFLEYLITIMPLELFVFIGTCIDEIISPIPAFLVLIPAGIAAHVQLLPLWYLSILAILSGFARTVSGYILYFFADKLEDVVFARGRKLFGYSHKEIEEYGRKLNEKSRTKSWLLLFTMHAMPVFPGTLLSLGSGFIRLPLSIFMSATFFGSTVVAGFFLYLGYSGVQTAELLKRLDTTSQIITGVVIALLIAWIGWRYTKYKQRQKAKVIKD